MKERWNQIKRVMAAWIDMHIVFLMNIVVYGLVVTVWRIGRDYFYDYVGSYSIVWTGFLYAMSYIVSMFLYYVFLEITILYFLFTGRMIYDTLLSKENMLYRLRILEMM